jgi:hypothetical protein
LDTNNRCPICRAPSSADEAKPNFTVKSLVRMHKKKMDKLKNKKNGSNNKEKNLRASQTSKSS